MTHDCEPFEVQDLIDQYSLAATPAAPDYDRLRDRLRTTPSKPTRVPRFRLSFPRIRRPVLALVIVLAVIVGTATAVLNNHTAKPVSARELLLGAAANTQTQPYTGTLIVSSAVSFPTTGFTLPQGTSVEGSSEQRIIHFAIRDKHHFRISIGWTQPAIDAGMVTFVANGGPLLVYDDRGNVYSTTSAYDLTVFDLTGGSPLASGGFGQFQSFQSVLNRLARATGATAQIVGHDTIAGRQTDIVSLQGMNFAPIRVWIDHAHPFILKWEQSDSAQVLTPGSFTAQVSSIRYGTGPTTSALRFQPPKGAVNVHREICAYACSSGLGASNGTFYPELYPGYFSVPPPASLPAAARNRRQVLLYQETFLLRTAPPIITYGNVASNVDIVHRQALAFVGPYVYIEERIHIHGLPAILKRGTEHASKACTFWGGTLPDGRQAVTLQRGRVSLSVHAKGLSKGQLVSYAKSTLCALPKK